MADGKPIMTKKDDSRLAAARQRAEAMAKAGSGGLSWKRTQQFGKDTWSELKKTTWPDRETLVKSTVIVLAFIVATAVWNGVIDLILTHATANLFGG